MKGEYASCASRAPMASAMLFCVGITPNAVAVALHHRPACTITGTSGADTITGTTGDDVICGLGGRDVIKARSGADIVYGGPGKDVCVSGLDEIGGNDTAIGGPGVDHYELDPGDAYRSAEIAEFRIGE